ncbi:type IV pilus modification PilV family protein [Leptospira idonii]|uniref:Type II secretion system protein n=1 Tax=Leptospira idonii TaxID=1193500 RepID=A0A4R9LYL0_9LEPT|nr:type II secretion system protein [Leptospira idonii]TGN18545.1 type II secretion system protein [Leptospira idonii]
MSRQTKTLPGRNRIRLDRKGFTLIEMAIGLAMAAVAMVYTYNMIIDGMKYQKKAVQLANAVHLAKIKMAQVDSSTMMQADSSKGEIPGYPGYRFLTEIKEEEMDLLKLAGGPNAEELKKKAPKDMLGDKDVGLNDLMKKRGKSKTFETGGILKVFRVRVEVTFPEDKNKNSSYVVETFRSTKY